MANMDFYDKHNTVAFLQKPTRSEEFHQIVDFLAGSHIRYTLTINPTIYVSLIEQFWQTITVYTVNDGEQQLTITVDGQTIAITEASVRRHLQLADVDGIISLPNTEIFDQLTLMGYVSNDDKLTFQKEQPSQVPITEPITDSFTTSHPTQTPSPMPHDLPLSGGRSQTLFKKDTEVEKTKTKRIAEETLLQESFKKLRTAEASRSEPIQEQPTEEPKELSEEELKKMLEIVPVEEIKAEALQVKYPIIDWEIHTEEGISSL
ncbi:hypothetical protein Tco_0861385 [Tanacetum coccineum]|uniref:Xylulose kinase-1 n=1 Tax=Tanacetum coccineum TaxID=301880 RepID=A0ABQ5BLA9_9ASTR